MKLVYRFGSGRAEGSAQMKDVLGGKGANLAEMTNLGLPVPPGFTIATAVCVHYMRRKDMPPGLTQEVEQGVHYIEGIMGRRFGDTHQPLLFSVRSGARASMPGMMDTVLNLGLNDKTVEGLASASKNPRFAWDSYRRLIQTYADVVMGMKPESQDERDPFEVEIEQMKARRRVKYDYELTVAELQDLVKVFKKLVQKRAGAAFPTDPQEQLWGAIAAVLRSWDNDRAKVYRRLNNIPDEWGTAVNVQAMVFGNIGDDSGTGVAFTRDPATGINKFYGEFLINAQGEDVVAGVRTPQPLAKLRTAMPAVYTELVAIRNKLESHYRDIQDVEFTIERGKLYILQTRAGKRTGFASVRIALEMVAEGLIMRDEAMLRIEPNAINHLLQPIFDPGDKKKAVAEKRLLAHGLAAGPGAACGRIYLTAAALEEAKAKADKTKEPGKEKVQFILVREETSPEDIKGMRAAVGILTARGGMTSHAALVARQMGKVCVVGCADVHVDYRKRVMTVGKRTLAEGDFLSLDGFMGEVFEGRIGTSPSEVVQVLVGKTLKPSQAPVYRQFARLMRWADEVRRLRVRANADQPDQATAAVALGAEGIGLCRTEHMFFGPGRIEKFRAMILAETEAERRKALARLLPLQRGDFEGIFRAMEGRPVTIRTLDPPLHEFLPHTEEEIAAAAKTMGVPAEKLRRRARELREANPMLGNRGCRLGIIMPEITEMQARAVFEAACAVKRSGVEVRPEVMIPLVSDVVELARQRSVVERIAEQVFKETGVTVGYQVGTMIEVPRAAVTADAIAREADFFSFGTNDLTQMTYGFSRDDVGAFLPQYLQRGILKRDPFETLDRAGVGTLLKMGVRLGRETKPELKVGICGEHGGDPDSVKFCHSVGLNYVSCSPFRVPIARLAAAQAVLEGKAELPPSANGKE
ncbi:MAG: pyruvate, phosphate dikinase [candidate division WOR-3 bacterium]|nr:pyruvate, phosphate dikinase [candidate division WOR-3 bacterium]